MEYNGLKITEITDYRDHRLDIFARMNERQLFHYYEPDEGIFIAESPKVAGRALEAGYEPLSILTEQKKIDKDMGELFGELNISGILSKGESGDISDENVSEGLSGNISVSQGNSGTSGSIMNTLENIPVYAASAEVIRQFPGYSLVRGMRCAFRRKRIAGPWDMVTDLARQIRVKKRESLRIAVLESVMNPVNVGAIFRSAAAMGMDAVIITSDSSDPLYRRAARVSMGTVFQIPWAYVDIREWTESGTDRLHLLGFSVTAMALGEDTIDIRNPALKEEERLAIVLGSEGSGLRKETIEKSDYTVMIPMSHGVDSLNVAAASAVAFWELRKH